MQYVVRDVAAPDVCGEAHAATDIYCPHRHTSRIQYPLPLIIGLVVTGVLAFMLTGFVGYFNCTIPYVVNGQVQYDMHGHVRGNPLCWRDAASGFLYLREPWPLYLWFSALMIVLLISILRARRPRLLAALVIAVLSIVIVAVVYLYGEGPVLNFLTSLLYQPWTWVIANFGLILAFIGDSGRRWLRFRATEMKRLGGDPSASMVARAEQARVMRARIGERIAGDLIAAMLLCAGLAIVFSDTFVQGVLATLGGSQFACGPTLFSPSAPYLPVAHLHGTLQQFIQGLLAGNAVSPYPCPVPVGPRLPIPLESVSATDLLLAGIFFVPGVGVLANTAFIRGLAPLSGASQETQDTATQAPDSPRAGDVAGRVGMSILDTLLEALEHYILPYVRSAALSLRNILWPLLILIASFSFALCSRFIQYYLHHYDPTYNCDPALRIPNCHPTSTITYLQLAGVFGILGFLCTVFSIALLLLSGRVVSNSLRFLGRIGGAVLLVSWMFSFALFGFNWFLLDTGTVPRSLAVPSPQGAGLCQIPSWQIMLAPTDPACRQPFSLSWVTAISFAALILAVFYLVLRLRGLSLRPASTRTANSTR